MQKKTLSTLIILSLITSSLSACNANISSKKTISTDTPYYSVTIGSIDKSKNTYMNLDVEVPKITYSNESASSLIDPLNTEIENSLNTIIEEAKNKALTTYETYIESAKNNAKADIENRINNLKEKYKNVLSDEEVKLISEFTIDDLERRPFNRKFMATMSDFPSFFKPKFNNNQDYNESSKDEKKDIDETVNGFTNSSNIIDPALHNKTIIIVETTENDIKETTIEVKGRPGYIAPSEDNYNNNANNFGNGNGMRFKNRGSKSDADRVTNESRPSNNKERNNKFDSNKQDESNANQSSISKDNNNKNQNKKIATLSESRIRKSISTTSELFGYNNNNGLINDEVNEFDIAEDITLENFYRDFSKISMTRIPDDYTLAMYYIPTTIKCNFEVKCLDEDYISLFVEISESRTTTLIKRLFYNVDLNKGKIINIKDFLGENYKDTTTKIINNEIDKWSDEQKSTLINNYSVENYISENTPFFINNNHRAVVQIEKFVITIGSAGYHEFQIP